VEGRLGEGNTASKTRPGQRAGRGAPSALDRVRRVARQDKGCAVHRAPAARRCRPPAGGLGGVEPEGRDGGGTRSGGTTTGRISKRSFAICTPGFTGARGGQGRRRGCGSRRRTGGGGRWGAAGLEDKLLQRARRRGAQRHLRDGLPRLLLRVPGWAQPASRVGCARGRDLQAEGELAARRGHPWLLGRHRPRVDAEVPRAPDRGPADAAPDPQMA
jgi:hypothetical protein